MLFVLRCAGLFGSREVKNGCTLRLVLVFIPHTSPDKRISPGGAAIIGAYLAKIGLSDAAIRYLTEAEPNLMNWLTAEKARQLGIDSRLLKENTAH
jgi:hypothetical protein